MTEERSPIIVIDDKIEIKQAILRNSGAFGSEYSPIEVAKLLAEAFEWIDGLPETSE